ncbi:MAG TPA: bifunctional glutamate N-acetyltransferase/amino-acid acetyltransferase ArgJ [Candidatus Angelobacter sp.]|nr:bifunctional glutamate N-acetyltransferase/amino-acid acetyltransferase ArgJ [Candidatus Angelobacter sp.]
MSLRQIRGGVTAPRGFAAAATRAGVRSAPGDDLAVVLSERGPVPAAAMFTTNRLVAAPVILSKRALRSSGGRAAAIVANAGCANAGTGRDGLTDAAAVRRAVARRLGLPDRHVLVASTGLIGSRLPVDRITAALPGLDPSPSARAGSDAARAIMTTDTRPKQAAAELDIGGRSIRIGGMAKGAGMIHPQMATMLAFLTTDAPVEPDGLRAALRRVVTRTFNQVSVDADPSTNDSVFLLASGAAGGRALTASPLAAFEEGLEMVCRSLAMQIAADGEGARHRIDVHVTGARTDAEARMAARAVASSNLVKSAVHGGDPNWGRIASAAGRSGARLDPERLRVRIGPIAVYDAAPIAFDERAASRRLRGKVVEIGLELGLGDGRGEAWGCDLSAEYVAINSEYRT